MICVSMGYPDIEDEIEIAKGNSAGRSIENVNSVITAEELSQLRQVIEDIYVHDDIYRYITNLVNATRQNPYVELGISPRGTIACTRMAKAWA